MDDLEKIFFLKKTNILSEWIFDFFINHNESIFNDYDISIEEFFEKIEVIINNFFYKKYEVFLRSNRFVFRDSVAGILESNFMKLKNYFLYKGIRYYLEEHYPVDCKMNKFQSFLCTDKAVSLPFFLTGFSRILSIKLDLFFEDYRSLSSYLPNGDELERFLDFSKNVFPNDSSIFICLHMSFKKDNKFYLSKKILGFETIIPSEDIPDFLILRRYFLYFMGFYKCL